MKLKFGDIFVVVNDGHFHIDIHKDLTGNVMEVVGLQGDQSLAHVDDLEVEDLKSGKRYTLTNDEMDEDEFEDHYKVTNRDSSELTTGAVKSDGGSSSYYDLELPEWLVDRIVERDVSEGKFYVKTEELIETIFNNDFDFGTVFKSLVRAQGAFYGAGKAGNTLPYECNKVRYYTNRIEQRNEKKEG